MTTIVNEQTDRNLTEVVLKAVTEGISGPNVPTTATGGSLSHIQARPAPCIGTSDRG
ncbi:hypothetical protein [Microvirga sp. BSC39]|uniref:hypothetical protein n=1 Tax=Microvirga sp. BSC39 TaxID=1549810 RepID=UPI001362C455|nr:hypothetical protein [Microvirga sp. BSC39]